MKISTLTRLVLNSPNGGVPMLMGAPGTAKTSIGRQIAIAKGWKLIDLRLSQMDETNLGEFPYISDRSNGASGKTVDFAIPAWAEEANKQPTLIFFDELNRAPQNVVNAALKLILEREIGVNFKFNDDVFMMAAGNLGAEDGTVVEEMDNALLGGRVLPIKWSITLKQWINDFANDNVNPIFIKYLLSNSEMFYPKNEGNEGEAFANPRSWHFLSNFIGKETTDLRQIKRDVLEVGISFIGKASSNFVYFLDEEIENQNSISLERILEDFDSIKKVVKKAGSVKHTEIIGHVEIEAIKDWTEKELNNFREFMKIISDEVRIIVISKIFDKLKDRKEIGSEKDLINYLTIFRDNKELAKQVGSSQMINKS